MQETRVRGCYVYEVKKHHDQRGFLAEMYNRSYPFKPKQTNWSHSVKNVVRGIHVSPYPKLVTCVRGRIFDVCLDMREKSPTYKTWVAIELSEQNGRQLLVPKNCGHGFMALDDINTIVYQQGGPYHPSRERSIYFLDPSFKIDWPEAEYIVSDKDRSAESAV